MIVVQPCCRLQKHRNWQEGISEFGSPGKEKGVTLGAWPEGSTGAEDRKFVIHCSREEVPARYAPLAKDREKHGIIELPLMI